MIFPLRFGPLLWIVGTLILAAATLSAQVPSTDPSLDPSEHAPFNDELLGEHPRLLFDSAELAQLRADIQSPPLQAHYNKLLAYLGSSAVPISSSFRTDATEAQRQGLWRMPTVALHYALTGNSTSRNRSIAYLEWLNGFSTWENGGEQDSGMAAANMMVGAALTYDWLYHELDPTFRETFRQKLFHHVREMWYRGHAGSQGGYWQVDPQNNHRWHRNAGLALCMLAVYEGNPEEEYMLRKVFDELAFVAEYLPDDGTSHESPTYLVFGGAHLTLALEAADNCFGTSYLDIPFYQNVGRFAAHTIAPGFNHFFMYGDASDSAGSYGQYKLLAVSRHQQADLQDAMDQLLIEEPNAFEFGWMGVVWRGTSQLGGDYHNLPNTDYFEDLGLTFVREGWNSGDAAAMFKSSPFGGDRLNDYRNENNGKYVNVAHDDPDANMFVLFKDDEWVAETDRYSYNKKSANLNSLLVDGKGQRVPGRAEGMQWSQPGGPDMKTMGYVTWEEDNIDTVVSEGEAQGSYLGDLTRFRRSFIWRSGEYVLVLDDIRASQNRRIDWLIQSGSVNTRNQSNLEFTLVKGSASCEFDVAATKSLSVAKQTSPADNRNNILGWQQLRLTNTATNNIQIASAYDMWDKGSLTVSLSNVTANSATVTVTGNGVNDTWEWTFAPDNQTASTIALVKPPVVQEDPVGEDVAVNQSAKLSVQRGGLGPISYQWYAGQPGDVSTPVGGDSATLETGALSEPTWFWVRLSTDYGTVDSDAFLIELTSGFLLWASDQGAGDTAEIGDPDVDGLATLLEYALGLSPTGSDKERPHLDTSPSGLTLNFSIPEPPLMDVLYEIQVSTTLTGGWTTVLSKQADGDWTGAASYTEGTASGGMIPVSIELNPGEFVRLKVTRI